MKKGWVYILECSDGSYYTGSTSNLKVRLYKHNNKTYGGYTANRLPVVLKFSHQFEDIRDAIFAERMIKNWTRKKKEALINKDFDLLHVLAECQNKTHYKNKLTK